MYIYTRVYLYVQSLIYYFSVFSFLHRYILIFMEAKIKKTCLGYYQVLTANKTQHTPKYRKVPHAASQASDRRRHSLRLLLLLVRLRLEERFPPYPARPMRSRVQTLREPGVHSGEPSQRRISDGRSRCREAGMI